MSRVIKLSTPKRKPANLPKTAVLTKAQADHKKWLKAHGIKVTPPHLTPDQPIAPARSLRTAFR
jgi:hypothetical protein